MEKKVRKRGLALLLCLVMVASLLPVMGASAADAPSPVGTPGEQVDGEGNDLKLEKALFDNHDGTFSVVLKGFAEGEIETQTVTEKIPTDFVIVVDQSGSMAYKDMPVDYNPVNGVQLETIAAAAEPTPGTANANGYYYKADDGNYYRVYPVRDYLYEYVAPNTLYAYDTTPASARQWFSDNEDTSFTAKNSIFCLDSDGNFYQLYFDIYGRFLKYNVIPHYTRNDGTTMTFTPPENPWFHQILNGNVIKPGDFGYGAVKVYWNNLFGGSDKYVFQELGGIRGGTIFDFPMYWRHIGYSQLAYRDVNGEVHIVPANDGTETTRYCDSNGDAVTTAGGNTKMVYDGLYTYNKATNESREAALKSALTRFADEVAKEADTFGPVDNRIAIVGFSSPGQNNTEVLTNTDHDLPSEYNGWQKSTADANASEYYGKALVGATTDTASTVNSKITSAINAITSNGGTQPEDGLNMAYQILDNRGDNTNYIIRSGEHVGETVKRNTVVIFFTDGQPGDFENSNQYKEANDVVEQAYNIKTLKDQDNQPLNTRIFSIGVFGESDGNPLTYEAHSTNSANEDFEFDLGFVKRVGRYSYLNRNWLQNNADHYGSQPNDTIFDYMSVVSSNYPAATQFMKIKTSNTAGEADTAGYADYLAMCAGVRGDYIGSNEYYRMASNQDTLIKAFLEAVTSINEETSSTSQVTLGEEAVLSDVIKMTDFDVTQASASAEVVGYTSGERIDDLSDQLDLDASELRSNGTVAVEGFDYSQHHSTSEVPAKIVVTISGLTPLKTGTLYSNDGNATIALDEEVFAETTSPVLVLDPETCKTVKVLDFNMIANVDTNVANVNKNATRAPGGEFGWAKAGDTLTFTPDMSTDGKAWNVSAFSGVNQTMYLKDSAWKQAVVIPAASIYVADNLKGLNSDYDDGVSGYDAKVVAPTTSTENTKDYRTITFYGTAIDIYCTTDDQSGWVSANLYLGDQALQSKLVKNNSVDTHYGCPTIHFEMDKADTYTLKIKTSEGSNYKFEGVRVYRPADADAQAYQPASESADFTRVRDILLAAETFNSAVVDGKTVSGAIFVEIKNAKNQPEETVTADVETYRDNGPRGEVYLEPNQAIAFKVDTTGPVLIGMSSADGTAVDYAVTNLAEETRVSTGTISSTVDMYYEAQPDTNGYICIKNNGESGLLAITYVRAPSSGAQSFSVDPGIMDYLANFDALIEEAQLSLKTAWNDNADATPKILSLLWQMLQQSFAQLFSGMGQW